MDAPISSTPAGDVVVDKSDDSTELDLPPKDDGVVLAQPAANPPVATSNPSIELLDMENPSVHDKDNVREPFSVTLRPKDLGPNSCSLVDQALIHRS